MTTLPILDYDHITTLDYDHITTLDYDHITRPRLWPHYLS